MTNTDWLQNLKVGDEVMLQQSGCGKQKHRVAVVDRVTETQIVIGNERFNRHNGHRKGDGNRYSYSYAFIVHAYPEKLAEVREANRRESLVASIQEKSRYADKLPTATLEAVWKLLNPEQPTT
jgi:hypothetical protein